MLSIRVGGDEPESVSRPSLSLAVVGANHPNARGPSRRFGLNLCRPGDPVQFKLEPKNPADPYAVAVFSERDIKLGYLTAERAPWIGGMIRAGREIEAIFQQQTSYGAVIRIAFDGAAPELPAAGREMVDDDQQPDSGWYPDEIWPDD